MRQNSRLWQSVDGSDKEYIRAVTKHRTVYQINLNVEFLYALASLVLMIVPC